MSQSYHIASYDAMTVDSPVATNGHHDTSTSIDFLSPGADDNGNAEVMKALYKDEIIYCPPLGWMHYTGTHWQVVSDAIVTRCATSTLIQRRKYAVETQREDLVRAARPSNQNIRSCAQLFRSMVTQESADVFDSDYDLLNCANGVVNLRTGSITPHYPCQLFTYCLDTPYNPDADTSVWNTFMHEVLQNEDKVHYMKRCIGYSLTGHTNEEKLFYLYGPPRAGKGTFTETVLYLLARPLSAEVDFNTFTAKRDADNQNFDLAPLKPSRIVFASESNRYQALNPAKVKQLTGGNLLSAAYKHKDQFFYKPQFKIWLISNFEINGDADDDAVWSRLQVLSFPVSHVGTEDKHLKSRLRSPESLEGVLKWIVEGAQEWYKGGLGDVPESVISETKHQRERQDYVHQWLLDDTHFLDGEWYSSARMTEAYTTWCKENNVKPLDAKGFSSSLTKRSGFIAERTRTGEKRARGYRKSQIHQIERTPGTPGTPETEKFSREKIEIETSGFESSQVSMPSDGPETPVKPVLDTDEVKPETTDAQEGYIDRYPNARVIEKQTCPICHKQDKVRYTCGTYKCDRCNALLPEY